MKQETMNVVGIIPARMGSSRFPGKPLARILGMPMVGHVYFRSKMAKTPHDIYIATCDTEIAEYAKSVGAKWVMTSDTHERASDRTAEAMLKIEAETGKTLDIVCLIQGDEPMVTPEMIDIAIRPLLEDESIRVANLMAPIKSFEEHDDPNCIKVVADKAGFALYFSREPIPTRKKMAEGIPMQKQVCIMPFRRDFLLKFNELAPTALERAESIDMNRVLEHGYKVKMIPEEFDTYSVDIPDDLRLVEKFMTHDPLVNLYPKK